MQQVNQPGATRRVMLRAGAAAGTAAALGAASIFAAGTASAATTRATGSRGFLTRQASRTLLLQSRGRRYDWSAGMVIEVRLRRDRLVITNPGGPYGITVDRLGRYASYGREDPWINEAFRDAPPATGAQRRTCELRHAQVFGIHRNVSSLFAVPAC